MKKNIIQEERVERMGNISFSLVEGSRQPVCGAFYYKVPGEEKKLKYSQ